MNIPNVNMELLRQQRDWLLTQYPDEGEQDLHNVGTEELDGLVNLLDTMLDIGEGHLCV